jgi:hypothetical protein
VKAESVLFDFFFFSSVVMLSNQRVWFVGSADCDHAGLSYFSGLIGRLQAFHYLVLVSVTFRCLVLGWRSAKGMQPSECWVNMCMFSV